MICWRNDDISHKTELGQFAEVHNLFKKYNVLHTVALICKDIERNPELIEYINANNIDVQIHCWEHYDFTQNYKSLPHDLDACKQAITRHFKHAPHTLYPPWNKSDETVEKIAHSKILTVNNKKISLSQYLKGVQGEVINFHSWCLNEIILLEDALKIYTCV